MRSFLKLFLEINLGAYYPPAWISIPLFIWWSVTLGFMGKRLVQYAIIEKPREKEIPNEEENENTVARKEDE